MTRVAGKAGSAHVEAKKPARRESAVSLNARAYRLQKRGRHAEAEPLLRRAVEIKPDYAYANYNLGWSLVEQGKAREALAPLGWSAAMQPGRWEPLMRLSEAHAQLGEKKKASEYARKAQALRSGRRVSTPKPVRTAEKTPDKTPELEPEIEPIVVGSPE